MFLMALFTATRPGARFNAERKHARPRLNGSSPNSHNKVFVHRRWSAMLAKLRAIGKQAKQVGGS